MVMEDRGRERWWEEQEEKQEAALDPFKLTVKW